MNVLKETPLKSIFFFDYLTERRMTPKQIYKGYGISCPSRPKPPNRLSRSLNIFKAPLSNLHHCLNKNSSPRSTGLLEVSIPTSRTRQNIAGGVLQRFFLWGIRDWWIRERRKGSLSTATLDKLTALVGSLAGNQKDPVR